jgi:preprotein translocase subunit SecE
MAEPAKKKRRIRKPETVREKAQKASSEPKARRLHKARSSAARPLTKARELGRREYHPIKLPDNRIGRFLTKPRRLTPGFLRNAWAELRQVTWPSRTETIKLTIAVFIFAIIFGALIAVTDYFLGKIFERLLT